MTMITPSYLGETIEYSSLHACRSTLEDPTTTRKYSKASGESVETEMKAMKEGKLKSGTGKKVTSRKQAIAIGLSKARKAGKKVPSMKS